MNQFAFEGIEFAWSKTARRERILTTGQLRQVPYRDVVCYGRALRAKAMAGREDRGASTVRINGHAERDNVRRWSQAHRKRGLSIMPGPVPSDPEASPQHPIGQSNLAKPAAFRP